MASGTCTCKSTAAFSKRSSRSGVVLHETATGGVMILVESIAPKTWRVLVGNDLGWRTGRWNSDNVGGYHEADGAPTFELAEPDKADITTKIPDPTRSTNAYNAAHSQYLRSKGLIAPAEEDEAKTTTGYTPRAKKVKSSSAFEADPPNDERYWYESEADTKAFKNFVDMRLAGHVTNAIVVGPSGFGKTEGIQRLAERLGVPCHILPCQVITTPDKWLGQMQADPEKGTYFEVSAHLQWVERTHQSCEGAPYCFIVYDELSRARPELENMLFSLLDIQQGLEVPQMGRYVHMDPKNVVFATANIGSAYTGTFALDWALRGRFDFTLERPFPPAEEEVKVITTASPKLTEQQAQQMIEVADHSRTLWKAGELESPISTRLLLSWARWVAGGYSIKEAAEYTIIPVYTEDGGADSDRAKIKLALDGKVSE